MLLWDIGECTHWWYYYPSCQAILYLVDTTADPTAIQSAKQELQVCLEDPALPEHVPVIVVVNKTDLPRSLPTHRVVNKIVTAYMCRYEFVVLWS